MATPLKEERIELPALPKPALDFSEVLKALSTQELPGGTMPRTMGMGIEDVQREWGTISSAIDKQMERYLATGGAANAQQQQLFEDATKLKQLQFQEDAARRADVKHQLSLANQALTEERQLAALDLQLARESRMENKDIAEKEHKAKLLERQQKLLDLQLKKEERLAETDLLNRQKVQEQINALKAKQVQTEKLTKNAQSLRQYALDKFGQNLSPDEKIELATDTGLARHLEVAYDMAKRDIGTVTQAKYEEIVGKAFKDYHKTTKKTEVPTDNLTEQLLSIFREVGELE